ncbi:cation diffusion facilitator family transporter [Guyparkeria halophila]|uniref:Cation diffusion facilitator family transporter n=1 Tax=Guyparkeria halophila TaxID=47960 RepID=A0A6I6CU55_9GAMM|nr:cation diffusion facilitator family transporter [Guyparkeria halophila]QGT77986.1 cation diffusion facilitator family transporter [Guyparkeria halophila]
MSNPHAKLLRMVTTASVTLALTLIALKLAASITTNSVSLLASLIDSTMDLLASLVTLVAVRIALQPPDEDHRYGHGKAEPLAALAQATFIAGSGVFLMIQALQRLIRPQELSAIDWGVGVMIFSMVATLALVSFQRYVIAKTRSPAIKADAAHYTMDFLVNASTIAVLILAGYGVVWLDPAFAATVGVFVLYSAWKLGRESLDQLMDREVLDGTEMRVAQIATAHPSVHAVDQIRTRLAGRTMIIQLYLYLDNHIDLNRAHQIGDEVEARLLRTFPGADVMIHEEPVSAWEPGRGPSPMRIEPLTTRRPRAGQCETCRDLTDTRPSLWRRLPLINRLVRGPL